MKEQEKFPEMSTPELKQAIQLGCQSYNSLPPQLRTLANARLNAMEAELARRIQERVNRPRLEWR
jgi:hypothetical protein